MNERSRRPTRRALAIVMTSWVAIGVVSLIPPIAWLASGVFFARGWLSVDDTAAP